MNRQVMAGLALAGLAASFCAAGEPAGKVAAGPVPPGAAALGYTKCVIRENPTAADVAPGRRGATNGSAASGTRGTRRRWITTRPRTAYWPSSWGAISSARPSIFRPAGCRCCPAGTVSMSNSTFASRTTTRDHWPAVWLMPAEHDGRHDSTPAIRPDYERFMELDVDEGGFGPG